VVKYAPSIISKAPHISSKTPFEYEPIRPGWLTWDQAMIYSSLPRHTLRKLIQNQQLSTKVKLIERDSIDRLLIGGYE
jgi:hypothetical protein